jgi:hypothetical protein
MQEETMQAKLTNRPVEQVIAAIRALDLEPIKLRVMDPELGEGWTREYAENIDRAYRKYLTVLVKHPEDAEDVVVSKDVDEFWHTHILHTMKYTEDCERVFGTYLHHNPHIGERTQADIERKAVLAEKTQRLYQQEFRAVGTAGVAWCAAAIETQNAAWCAAAAEPAWCAAAVRSKNVAWCAAAVEPAWCAAAVESKNAAWCAAAIKPESAAWCAAAQPASKEARSSMQTAASPAI